MSDEAERAQTMLAGLRDIRLPAEAAGGALADMAAAVALGAFAALLIAGLTRLIGRRVRRGAAPEADPLDALAELAPDDRRVALLHLLRARDPERYARLRQNLYRREAALDLAALEAEVRSLV